MESSSADYIDSLMRLQTTIGKSAKVQEKGNSLDNPLAFTSLGKLWVELDAFILRYFEERITALQFRELAHYISKSDNIPMPTNEPKASTKEPPKEKPSLRYYCVDSKRYLEELYGPLISILMILRDDREVFGFMANMIERTKGLEESGLSFLANEIIVFLLEDFTSSENYAAHCVFLLKPLIHVAFPC